MSESEIPDLEPELVPLGGSWPLGPLGGLPPQRLGGHVPLPLLQCEAAPLAEGGGSAGPADDAHASGDGGERATGPVRGGGAGTSS